MKKILTVAIATMLSAACVTGIAVSASAVTNAPEAAPAAETAHVYLLPGTWYDAAEKETRYNTVTGATALTAEEKAALHLEADPNVYKAGEAGSKLPAPATEKKDAEGQPFVFQGWWYIEKASVTYTETVPEAKENLYLYADFRAEASQRHDPVAPPEQVGAGDKNFMEVIHEDGTTEYLPLLVSGSDSPNITQMGYGVYVQFSNEYFALRRNDRLSFYLTDIGEGGDEEPTCYPKPKESGSFSVSLESNGSGTNRSSDYLCEDTEATAERGKLTLAFMSTESMTFRVYFKIATAGTLNVYIEPKA